MSRSWVSIFWTLVVIVLLCAISVIQMYHFLHNGALRLNLSCLIWGFYFEGFMFQQIMSIYPCLCSSFFRSVPFLCATSLESAQDLTSQWSDTGDSVWVQLQWNKDIHVKCICDRETALSAVNSGAYALGTEEGACDAHTDRSDTVVLACSGDKDVEQGWDCSSEGLICTSGWLWVVMLGSLACVSALSHL